MTAEFLSGFSAVHASQQIMWQQWLDDFTMSHVARHPKVFWYLSSGLDFIPVQKFGDNRSNWGVDIFLYSDYAALKERLIGTIPSGQKAVHIQSTSLYLKSVIPVLSDAILFPVTFLLIDDSDKPGAPPAPLFLMECTNDDALQVLLRWNITCKYLSTVADGCRALDTEKATPCPMLQHKKYGQAIPDGYWLSDHQPQRNSTVFSPVKTIEGWGRYNVNERTTCFKMKVNPLKNK